MSTKLNAEELRESAMDYMGWDVDTEMGELYTPTRKSMIADLVGFASSEVAQPIADERDEAIRLLNECALFIASGPMHNWIKLKEISVFLAKYNPKP